MIFLLFFAFFDFFVLKLFSTGLDFWRPGGEPLKVNYFQRLCRNHRKYKVIFGRRLLAAENIALFSANFFWRPETTENKLKAAENSLFSAAQTLFLAVPGRRKSL
jgi:hypothetical protein